MGGFGVTCCMAAPAQPSAPISEPVLHGRPCASAAIEKKKEEAANAVVKAIFNGERL